MQSYSSRIVSPFYGLINRSSLNYFFILATIPLNFLNCTFYKKLQCHQENMETSYYIYDAFIFFLSQLSEKAYKRRHDHCERKCCSSFRRFSYLAKCLNSNCIGGWRITGKNLVSDLQVPTLEIFVLKTIVLCPWTNKGTGRRSFFKGKGSCYRHCTIYL